MEQHAMVALTTLAPTRWEAWLAAAWPWIPVVEGWVVFFMVRLRTGSTLAAAIAGLACAFLYAAVFGGVLRVAFAAWCGLVGAVVMRLLVGRVDGKARRQDLKAAILQELADCRDHGEGAAGGFRIAQAVARREGLGNPVPHGTLYRALAELEASGAVRSWWESAAAAAERGAPPRKMYELP